MTSPPPPRLSLLRTSSSSLSTHAEAGRINDQLNSRGKVMNNVYVLIIHGGQPSTSRRRSPGNYRAHLNNINYPSDFNQARRSPNYLRTTAAKSGVRDQQAARRLNPSVDVSTARKQRFKRAICFFVTTRRHSVWNG